jgi:hypothetical protein
MGPLVIRLVSLQSLQQGGVHNECFTIFQPTKKNY